MQADQGSWVLIHCDLIICNVPSLCIQLFCLPKLLSHSNFVIYQGIIRTGAYGCREVERYWSEIFFSVKLWNVTNIILLFGLNYITKFGCAAHDISHFVPCGLGKETVKYPSSVFNHPQQNHLSYQVGQGYLKQLCGHGTVIWLFQIKNVPFLCQMYIRDFEVCANIYVRHCLNYIPFTKC